MHMERIVCFGCGNIAESFLHLMDSYKECVTIEYFLDNYRKENHYNGYPCYITQRNNCIGKTIVVTNIRYYEEIARQLESYGLQREKDFYSVRQFVRKLGEVHRPGYKRVKVSFMDFWPGFDCEFNYFLFRLMAVADVTIDDKQPDLIIASVFGKKVKEYNCTKIMFTGEPVSPDFQNYDYNIGFDYNDDVKYLRWPLYYLYEEDWKYALSKHEIWNFDDFMKRGFCSRVVSNGTVKYREDFFDYLNAVRYVASGGGAKNNIPGGLPVGDKKRALVRQYKFNLAFETESRPGFTTEKIIQAWSAGAIPIYWGDPMVSKVFNRDAFFEIDGSKSTEHYVKEVLELANDNERLYKMLATPILNEIPDPKSEMEEFLKGVIDKM